MTSYAKWIFVPVIALACGFDVPEKADATDWSITIGSGYYGHGGHGLYYGGYPYRSYYRSPQLHYSPSYRYYGGVPYAAQRSYYRYGYGGHVPSARYRHYRYRNNHRHHDHPRHHGHHGHHGHH